MACSRWSTGSVNSAITLIRREYEDVRSVSLNNGLLRRRLSCASNLYRKDLYSHFGCVNAIEFSNNGQWLVSGGDDRRVLLWNVEKAIHDSGQAVVMKGEHGSNIFCLGFDSQNRRIFSAGNDEQVFIHDTQTGETLRTVLHMEAIYGLSVDPFDDNVFATACSDGGAFIFDARGPNQNQWDACITLRSNSPFHAVMHNPVEPRLIATANTKDGVGLWDTRSPNQPVLRFTDCLNNQQSAMSVRFNMRGTQILSLRRRQPPVLYNLTSAFPVAEFDHVSYYNSCTMKSCCFAGQDDEYVLSGSDDFKLYVWRVPDMVTDRELTPPDQCEWVDEAHMVLLDHRSIVNQVRFNYSNSLIASSGVEKIIKLWSTFPLPNGSGSLGSEPLVKDNRKVYSHEDYINLVLESGQHMTHDYSHQSVREDARMMAFFDSLVQRDIEGWTSESDSDSYEGRFNRSRYTNMRSSSSTSGDEEEIENSLKVLNPLSLSYVQKLNQRIECNRRLGSVRNKTAAHSHTLTATSSGRESAADPLPGPSASHFSGPEVVVPVDEEDIGSEVNKIAHLIHEKKREQLRKVSRLAVRTTRRRLKKMRRFCASVDQNQPQTSTAAEKAARYQSLVRLTDQLNESVDADTKTCVEENNARRSKFKLRRRLRYLTNQSDYILNDAYPRHSPHDSDSSSVSSDGPVVWRSVRGNIHILDDEDDEDLDDDAVESCDSTSDHESDTSLSDSDRGVGDAAGVRLTEGMDGKTSPSSSDKQVQVDTCCRVAHPVLLEELEVEDECKSQPEASGSQSAGTWTLRSGPVVKLIKCLCEGTADVTAECKCNEETTQVATASTSTSGTDAVVFKSVTHVNRSVYRKRKLADDQSPSSPTT